MIFLIFIAGITAIIADSDGKFDLNGIPLYTEEKTREFKETK